MPLTIGIRNPSYTYKESETQPLESGIHGLESRIQDCLRLPYMGRLVVQGCRGCVILIFSNNRTCDQRQLFNHM